MSDVEKVMSSLVIEDMLNIVRSTLFQHDHASFPPVMSQAGDGESVSLVLDLQPDLNCFRGHFPGSPILPGVLQLHWAVAVAQAAFGFPEPPQEILRLKFKSIVEPPRNIALTVLRRMPAEITFEYRGEGLQYSEGCLRFSEGGL